MNLTFAAGLRAILRHDPDIIMIGEIRDLETADAAVRASLTGHLVFSTLHTNDAPGALTRLMDMGVEPFLVASSLEGVLAQRLVRVLCTSCRKPYTPDSSEIPPELRLDPGAVLMGGVGCRECRNTGYSGRVGIYELLMMNGQIRELIMSRANARQIAQSAATSGDLSPLRDSGFDKVLSGQTTMAEVLRATQA